MRRILFFMMITLSATFSASAWSLNLDFLNDSTTAKFEQNDWKMADAALETALKSPVGNKITWHNQNTGHGGFAQTTHTTVKDGKPCRRVRIFNRAKSLTDHYNFTFCKSSQGWVVVK